MKIDHVQCEILCDDVALVEHQEKSEPMAGDKKAKSCYIISEEGKQFMFRVRSKPHQVDAMFDLWIDGQRLNKACIEDDHHHVIRGARVGELQRRPFIFSPIITTDDDSVLKQSLLTTRDFGTICLKVYRVKIIGQMGNARPTISQHPNSEPVHEKTKKAGTHRVALGDIETVDAVKSLDITLIDPMDSPCYTFTWRYRPKAILQAQGIVPQDPPPPSNKRAGSSGPSGSSSKRPRVDTRDSGEGSSSQIKLEDIETARELQARQAALRAQRAALEAQEAALAEDLRQADANGIKREASPIVLGAGDGVVIDLTEDD